MSRTSFLTVIAGALAAPALALAAYVPQAEPALKSSDHEKAGKVIGERIEANPEQKDIAEKAEKMWAELAKWEKKEKRDPLSMTADLQQALWHSHGYDKQRVGKKGSVEDIEVKVGDGTSWSYSVHLPSKYKADDRPYPLLLLVPEKYTDGEKPKDWIVENWVSSDVRDGAVLVVVHMPEDVAIWGEVFAEDRKRLGGVGAILQTFAEVKDRFAVDFDKVFVIGRMEGLVPAIRVGSYFPDRFAGIAGRSGDISENLSAKNFKNLPTWFSGPGANVTAFAEQIDKLGYGNCTVLPEGKEEDLWNWIGSPRRVPTPPWMAPDPGTPFPRKAPWLEIPPWDGVGEAAISATVDRATNTITVDGKGVVEVTLFLSDLIVDLEREVRVICNGVTHIDMIPRSKSVFEKTILLSRSDAGKLYVCEKTYDLPAAVTGGSGDGN